LRASTGKTSLTISVKPDGVGLASQRLIPAARTIWIADAHRGDEKRFIVRADEMLTAFLELESAGTFALIEDLKPMWDAL